MCPHCFDVYIRPMSFLGRVFPYRRSRGRRRLTLRRIRLGMVNLQQSVSDTFRKALVRTGNLVAALDDAISGAFRAAYRSLFIRGYVRRRMFISARIAVQKSLAAAAGATSAKVCGNSAVRPGHRRLKSGPQPFRSVPRSSVIRRAQPQTSDPARQFRSTAARRNHFSQPCEVGCRTAQQRYWSDTVSANVSTTYRGRRVPMFSRSTRDDQHSEVSGLTPKKKWKGSSEMHLTAIRHVRRLVSLQRPLMAAGEIRLPRGARRKRKSLMIEIESEARYSRILTPRSCCRNTAYVSVNFTESFPGGTGDQMNSAVPSFFDQILVE
jgi:hypothetical protein